MKIIINPSGDIFIKRLSKANVFIHQLSASSARKQPNKVAKPNGDNYSGSPYGLAARDGSLPTTRANLYGLSSNAKVWAPRQAGLAKRIGPKSSDQSLSSSGNSSGYGMGNYSLESARNKTGFDGENEMKTTISTTNTSSLLELERVVRVFNMEKFKQIVDRESRRPYPNRLLLRNMCISVVSFVLDDKKLLNLPSWIIVINMVAIDLLSRKIGLGNGDGLLGRETFLSSAKYSLLNSRGPFPLFGSELSLMRPSADWGEKEAEDEFYRKFHGISRSRLPNSVSQQMLVENASRLNRVGQRRAHLDGEEFTGAGALLDGRAHLLKRSSSNGHLSSRSDELILKETNNSDHAKTVHSDEPESNVSSEQAHSSDGPQSVGEETGVGSSSSGFNSNSSLQMNDADESSGGGQIGHPSGPIVERNLHNNKKVAKKPRPPLRRPTKPARLLQGLSNPNLVSDPIPIPAPPTSEGGPSGRANLILVSPTGLSPPLAKKELRQANGGQFGASELTSEAQAKSSKTLPAGIPQHAQLAPPATQRHILRYLMSAVAHSNDNIPLNSALAKPKGQARPARRQQPVGAVPLPGFHRNNAAIANRRPQRPLPVLPDQRHLSEVDKNQQLTDLRENRSNESLYHSGLMARVPKYHVNQSAFANQPHKQPAPNTANGFHYPVTKSAINDILTDFKLQSHNQFNYVQHYRNQAASPDRIKAQERVEKHRHKQPISLSSLKTLSANLSLSASALVQGGFGRSKKMG